MENTFLETKCDKFTNTTLTRAAYWYVVRNDSYKATLFNINHFSSADGDCLAIDVCNYQQDWLFLRNGCLRLNINDVENITLKPREQATDSFTIGLSAFSNIYGVQLKGEKMTYCFEHDSYYISQDLLKKICDANTLDIQIVGEYNFDVNANDFVIYARLFYNAFYDNEAYKDIVEKNSKKIAPKNSGCMLALGIIGSMAAACVYSLCTLFSNIF